MSFTFPWRTRRQITSEVDEELQYHIEARYAELTRDGLPADEARAQAIREFGDVDATRDYCRAADLARERERRRRDYLGDLVQDLRYAIRTLRRRPAVTAVVVASLALAVGLNTAMFSVVNAVLLRPLPYPEPSRLVALWEADEANPQMSFAHPNFLDLAAQTRTLTAIGGYRSAATQTAYRGQAAVAELVVVTPGFLPAFGVSTWLGRGFSSEEEAEGGPLAVVVGHGYWRTHLGGDPDVVGQPLTVAGRTHSIVGVMPPGFAFPRNAELYAPDQAFPLGATSRSSHNTRAIARLAPGVDERQVTAELRTIGAALATQFPAEMKRSFHFLAVPLLTELTGATRDSLVVLLVLVSVVLLIGCANLAFVLLAQAAGRGREMAIRAAVGGGTARLVRQLLTESLALGVLGGLGGLLLTVLSLGLVNRFVPATVLHSGPVAMDWRVGLYALGLGILAGLAFGLAPAWRSARLSPNQVLRSDTGLLAGGGRRPFGGMLLVAQYALSFAALVTAATMVRSFQRLEAEDHGFQVADRVAAQLLVPVREGTRYPDQRSAMAFLDRFEARLRQQPGVIGVSFDRAPPLGGGSGNQKVYSEEGGDVLGDAWPDARTVAPGYFGVMGIPLLRGREFERGDSLGRAPVAIINRALAERLWPGQDPIGHRFKRWPSDPWITVVGEVGDVRTRLDREPPMSLYLPVYQDPWRASAMNVILHGHGGGEALGRLVRETLRAEDPELGLRNLRTLEEIRAESIALPRFRTRLVTTFGGLALLLVLLGVYGVISYAASLRKQEMAIRSALGARPTHLTALFVGQGLRIAILGTLIGVVLALGLGRLVRSVLFGIEAVDPLLMAALVPVLAGSVLLACLMPARRASRTDPARALRTGGK